MQTIVEKIKQYQTIIIHRHQNPDLDALGSQLGLKDAIKETFPEKNVYAVGDENRFSFIGKMDEISDELYNGALVIICDVAVSHMISDYRYFLADEVIVIDHHNNGCVLDTPEQKFEKESYIYIDSEKGACAELIAKLVRDNGWKLSPNGATSLFGGIITDTGRFQYGNHLEHTLLMASFLVEKGANPQFIYKNLYVESLETRLIKNYFQNKMQVTEHNVAYMINDKDVYEKFNLDAFSISRGMVNLMAGIQGINIWANFTYDPDKDAVLGEFRSRDIVIVDVAKKYGGGGHEFACGATLANFEEAMKVVEDFNQMMIEFNKNN